MSIDNNLQEKLRKSKLYKSFYRAPRLLKPVAFIQGRTMNPRDDHEVLVPKIHEDPSDVPKGVSGGANESPRGGKAPSPKVVSSEHERTRAKAMDFSGRDVQKTWWEKLFYRDDVQHIEKYEEGLEDLEDEMVEETSRFKENKRFYEQDIQQAGVTGRLFNRWRNSLVVSWVMWVIARLMGAFSLQYALPLLVAAQSISFVQAVFAVWMISDAPGLLKSFGQRFILPRFRMAAHIIKYNVAKVYLQRHVVQPWVQVMIVCLCLSVVSIVTGRIIRRIKQKNRIKFRHQTLESFVSERANLMRKAQLNDWAYVVDCVVALAAAVLGCSSSMNKGLQVYNLISRSIKWLRNGVLALMLFMNWGDEDDEHVKREIEEIAEAAAKAKDAADVMSKTISEIPVGDDDIADKDKSILPSNVKKDIASEANKVPKKWRYYLFITIISSVLLYAIWVVRRWRKKVLESMLTSDIKVYYDVDNSKWTINYLDDDGHIMCEDLPSEEIQFGGRVILIGSSFRKLLPSWVDKQITYVQGNMKKPYLVLESGRRIKMNRMSGGNYLAYDETGKQVNVHSDDILLFEDRIAYDEWRRTNPYNDNDFTYDPNEFGQFGLDFNDAPRRPGPFRFKSDLETAVTSQQGVWCRKTSCDKKCGKKHFLPPCTDTKCDFSCGKYHKKPRNSSLKVESTGDSVPAVKQDSANRHCTISVHYANGNTKTCKGFSMYSHIMTVAHIFSNSSSTPNAIKSVKIIFENGKELELVDKCWVTDDEYDLAMIQCKNPMLSYKLGVVEQGVCAAKLVGDSRDTPEFGTYVAFPKQCKIEHSCPTKEGDCGKALIDRFGKVIGLHFAGDGSKAGKPTNEAVLLTTAIIERLSSKLKGIKVFSQAPASQ